MEIYNSLNFFEDTDFKLLLFLDRKANSDFNENACEN